MSNFNYLLYKETYETPARIITTAEIPTTGGFVSTYVYDEALPEYFEVNKTIRGFAGISPSAISKVFYVDFDNNKEAANRLYEKLMEDKISFRMYDSGGRSIHFHIQRQPVVSAPYLPLSDKRWAEENIPGCDTVLYQHSRVFRLPNTVHHKTGNKKILLEENKGNPLHIQVKEVILPKREKSDTVDYKALFNDTFIVNCIYGARNGNRNKTFYALTCRLSECGCDEEFIRTYVKACNAQCKDPLDSIEIDTILDYGVGV